MAEELRQYYNEALDQTANAENFGTPLQNTADEDLHVREVDVMIHAESIAVAEGAMVEITKRSSRSQSVGLNPPTALRTGAAGSKSALTSTADMNVVTMKSKVYARGAFTLETGESLYSHLTELKDGGTYDIFVDIKFHY